MLYKEKTMQHDKAINGRDSPCHPVQDEMIAKAKEWRPAYFISCQQRQRSLPDESANPYALIILNQPISNTAVFSEACNGGECTS